MGSGGECNGAGKSPIDVIVECTIRNEERKQKLDDIVTLLERRHPPAAFKALLGVKTLLEVVRDTQKQVRNLSEDLFEDVQDLDDMEGLSEFERLSKKKAIAAIEVLADEVDKTRSRLEAMSKAPNATAAAFDAELSSQENTRPLKLKVELNGDIRRNDLIAEANEPTLQDVQRAVGQLYGFDLACVDGLSLKFRDAAGTLCVLADDSMGEALSVANHSRMLRLAASRL
jgi:hypothetical protein